ncbi:YfhH family protein [Salinicoccus roseus]|nr:YfhH family protein [Salinicoccus roseus]
MKPLNTMTRRELEAYIAEKREAMRKAEMMGVENEYRVLERQVLIAESYFIDLSLIEPGKIYKIISNEDHYFKVEYVKGIFAWGFFVGGEDRETGIPVSMLQLNKRG